MRVEVRDEATAIALLQNPDDQVEVFGLGRMPNNLMDAQGREIGISRYHNGMLRPIAFSQVDSTHWLDVERHLDDPYRMNGRVIAWDPDGDGSPLAFDLAQGPQHGHAWVDGYTGLSTRAGYDHTAVPFLPWVEEHGAWQHYSHLGDPYGGQDPFTVRVSDADGAYADTVVNAIHVGSLVQRDGGKCPIVLDLHNDGIELLRPEDSNVFADINADGWRERIGWAAPADAVLVFDANRDGRADLEREVSFVEYLPAARTDLEGLAAFDTDGDHKLTAADADWRRFGLFQDKNANGRQDDGEYATLDAAGIAAIGLQREGSPVMNNANVVFGTSSVQWADGRSSRAGDVMFAGQNVPLPEAVAEALGMTVQEMDAAARMQRTASLFIQMVNTAVATDDAPIAFVPLEDPSAMHAAAMHEQAMGQAAAALIV
jgi:hypothetical protein